MPWQIRMVQPRRIDGPDAPPDTVDACAQHLGAVMPMNEMVGVVGRVTGVIGPKQVGEVMLAIRGGSEAFHAYSEDREKSIEVGTRVIVVEYFPPRTIIVTPF